MGAWFANSLSCARGDVIRAVGSVAGGTSITACRGPVSAIVFHHPEDRLTPFVSGERTRDQLIATNGCDPDKTVSYGHPDSQCREYVQCETDARVIWCPHRDSIGSRGQYYPHTWPDFASEMIWEFFESLE